LLQSIFFWVSDFLFCFCLVIASAQIPTGFILFVKETPPPDEPGEWGVCFPTTISAQGLLSNGFQPWKWSNTPAGCDMDLSQGIANRFPKICRKAWSVYRNAGTGETLVVEDFTTPKPFGFTMQRSGLCKFEADSIAFPNRTPVTIQIGNFKVTMSSPPTVTTTITGVRPTTPTQRTPPKKTPPPPAPADEEVWPEDDDNLPIPQPIPPDDPALNSQNQTPSEDENQTWPENETGPEPTVETHTQPPVEEQRPSASKYPDVAGTWRRSGWTQYAIFTITQSGNKIQWTHDYLWGAGMHREVANGTVTEINGGPRIEVDIDYDEPNGSHSKASYTGRVSCDANGKGVTVEWSNNSTIVRED
jgi:hypothetical protein